MLFNHPPAEVQRQDLTPDRFRSHTAWSAFVIMAALLTGRGVAGETAPRRAVLFVTAATTGRSAVTGPNQFEGSNRYESESRYGKPHDYTLDENPDTWPEDQSIRTVGFLQPGGGTRSSQSNDGTHYIKSENGEYGLALKPVWEIADLVARDAPWWLGREVEVVGVFPRRSAADIQVELRRTNRTFVIWSMLVLPEREDDEFDAPRSSLDALVMDTEAAAGRMVTVTGNFRGGNLLEDLPNDSRRNKDDWVLCDGPFSIWVTGMKPEGEGFSLGLRSRSDLRWELVVQGEVEVDDGYIYLRAEKIRLVGPARDESE